MPWLWRRRWHPTPVLLPGKSHGQRSLVGYSPWGCSEPDRIEWLHFHFSPSCIGEGNGNPLQYSCLENPRDGGAGGLPSIGSHRVRHDWSNLAAAACLDLSVNEFRHYIGILYYVAICKILSLSAFKLFWFYSMQSISSLIYFKILI